ncbi:mRNA binding protein puf3 [Tulasnella sp. 418]|nr:mRNA binding protein puf3 [Tulasnella sp. 418]
MASGSVSRKPSGSSAYSGTATRSPSTSPLPGGTKLGPASAVGFPMGSGVVSLKHGTNAAWQDSTLSLPHARHRQSGVAQATGLSAPQHYGDSPSPKMRQSMKSYPTSDSPFAMPPAPLPHEGLINPYWAANSEQDLSLGLKGLGIQENYDRASNLPSSAQAASYRNLPPHLRHQPQYPYSPRDYPHFYAPQGPDTFPDFYESYPSASDPSSYSSAPPAPLRGSVYGNVGPMAPGHHGHGDVLRSPTGVFYSDFNGSAARGAGPFFYPHPPPHQSMMFHPPPPSPHLTNLSAATAPLTPLVEKSRDIQGALYSLQQQQQSMLPQMFMPTMRQNMPSYSGMTVPVNLPMAGRGAGYPGRNSLHPNQVYQPGGPNNVHRPHHKGRRTAMDSSIDSGVGLRSDKLEEFRANKSKNWEVKEIFGHVVEFSGDQHGSRFIQQKLETASSEEKQVIFDEILPDHALSLITDVFGNYVIQKLFEYGTAQQKEQLAATMTGHILSMSQQMYGCRVVQKAIEHISSEQQSLFIKELDSHAIRCVKDANGNHVIQKLIECVPPERLTFVNSFRGHVFELASHPYGCRVLQRCFEHLLDDQKRPLLDELHRVSNNLAQDQFGNYVIQFVLEFGTELDRSRIIARLRGHMLTMARHKFASNVCEKALVTASSDERRHLIDEMMAVKSDGLNPILVMMKDQFANYVLQRALTVAVGDQLDILIGKVKPQMVNIRRHSTAYGKHLLSIERIINERSRTRNAEASANSGGLPEADSKPPIVFPAL